MAHRYCYIFPLMLATGLGIATLQHCRSKEPTIVQFRQLHRPPMIYPDYASTVIPPNIAPLRFVVMEEGTAFLTRIGSSRGEVIEVHSTHPAMLIPEEAWHRLLAQNRNEEIYFEVSVRAADGQWDRFERITNKIATEEADCYLVYRKTTPGAGLVNNRLCIYQRSMWSYNEDVVLDSRHVGGGCLNCHSFRKNRGDIMLMGFRSQWNGDGTVFVDDGVAHKIPAKFGFTSWHPSGRLAVYSINNLTLIYRPKGREFRESVNLDSALLYYRVDERTIKTASVLSQKDRLENWPAWSADGRHLYFCRALRTWSPESGLPQSRAAHQEPSASINHPERYREVKYDLVRVGYDLEQDKWHEPQTILSSQDTGLSIAIPRTSPDGRWLSFCMLDRGYFPGYDESSDIYLVDLRSAKETGRYEYRRLELNSSRSEAWHTWSSNSRWIAFSSKRDNGVFTRLYVSYVNGAGRAYKPLLLPQEDPSYLGSEVRTYNLPEFLVTPVVVTGDDLGRVIRSSAELSVDAVTLATPKALEEEDSAYY